MAAQVFLLAGFKMAETLTPEEKAALEADRISLCEAEAVEQAAFFAENGKYQQRLRANARVQGDVNLWADEYISDNNGGYLEKSEAVVREILWHHTENHGPDTHFEEHDWREYTSPGSL